MEQNQNRIVTVQGDGFYFRPLELTDAENCTRWMNDPEVTRFLKAYLPMGLGTEKEYLEKVNSRPNDISFAIVLEDGTHIGNTALHRISWKDRVATTGTLIGEKAYWGKGWGTKAKLLLLDYAFNTLNMHKICSSVFAYNERSLKCQLRCGYVEEGRQRRQIFREGQYHDKIMLGVFKEEFEAARQAYLGEQKV